MEFFKIAGALLFVGLFAVLAWSMMDKGRRAQKADE